MSIWIAALAAVAVQPLVFLARIAPAYLTSPQPLYGIGFMFVAVVVVASAAVLILGIPTFLMLRKLRREGWVSLALVLGALPPAFSWPRRLEGLSAARN